jgi:biotin transporter BioY
VGMAAAGFIVGFIIVTIVIGEFRKKILKKFEE